LEIRLLIFFFEGNEMFLNEKKKMKSEKLLSKGQKERGFKN